MDLCINMEALRLALIREINNSNLTIGAATFVVKDVYNTLYLSFLEEKDKELYNKNIKIEHEEVQFEEPIQVEEVMENGEQNND